MRIKLLACEILFREACAAAAASVNQVDVHFLHKGLHDIGSEKMSAALQKAIDRIEDEETIYDAILLGYGLCNNGVVGLSAVETRLVLPRAHDCITLFLGCKERYRKYFEANPGTYFKTSGWIERGDQLEQLGGDSIQDQSGLLMTFDEMVDRYGEDNARFLWDQLGNLRQHYSKITYIEMGVEPDDRFERRAREDAAENEWKFEKVDGDMTLIRQLVDGPWDNEKFLVVEPGQRIAPQYNELIVQIEKEE